MPLNSYQKSRVCARAAVDKKGFDPVILAVKDLTSIADYFVIVSGTSDTQVHTIASHVEEVMAARRLRPLGIEGVTEGRWVLLDYVDVIVHVFLPPVRRLYDLEGLWSDARRIAVKPPARRAPAPGAPLSGKRTAG